MLDSELDAGGVYTPALRHVGTSMNIAGGPWHLSPAGQDLHSTMADILLGVEIQFWSFFPSARPQW
jgi:hypothetical protein